MSIDDKVNQIIKNHNDSKDPNPAWEDPEWGQVPRIENWSKWSLKQRFKPEDYENIIFTLNYDLLVEKAIYEAELLECLTSPSFYIRELKKIMEK